jgi:hypothetical protein
MTKSKVTDLSFADVDKLMLENKAMKQEIAVQKHLIDEQNKVIKLYLDKLKKEAKDIAKDGANKVKSCKKK